MNITRGIAPTILLPAMLVLAGCGHSKVAEVSGTITYDGKPLQEGAIVFFPADGNGPTSGSVIQDGKYVAQKVWVGDAKIQITSPKDTGIKKKVYDTQDSPEVSITTELLPAKYNSASELKYTVTSGKQIKDFDLGK
jgi:hypothetical protein